MLWVVFAVIAIFVVVGYVRVRGRLNRVERQADQPQGSGEHEKHKHKHGSRPE